MAKFKVTIDKVEPIGKVEVGTFNVKDKDEALKEGYFELGLHAQRYLEPMNTVWVTLEAKKIGKVI